MTLSIQAMRISMPDLASLEQYIPLYTRHTPNRGPWNRHHQNQSKGLEQGPIGKFWNLQVGGTAYASGVRTEALVLQVSK